MTKFHARPPIYIYIFFLFHVIFIKSYIIIFLMNKVIQLLSNEKHYKYLLKSILQVFIGYFLYIEHNYCA
jgi:hypothetical protein